MSRICRVERRARVRPAVGATAWAIAIAVAIAAAVFGAGPAAGGFLGGEEQRIVEEINRARADRHLPPLRAEPRLTRIARQRAQSMARSGGIQSARRARAALDTLFAAESYSHSGTVESALLGVQRPREMVADWIDRGGRPLHQTVLETYEHLGVGVARTRDGRHVVAMVFATPRLTEELEVTSLLADLDTVRRQVLDRSNRARRRAGRDPLVSSPDLTRAAQKHAEDMLLRGYFDHTSPEGGDHVTRALAAGYVPMSLRENIAQGQRDADEVVEGWLDSPGHRKNLLASDVDEIGVGVAWGRDDDEELRVVWVQVVGRSR
jgi:uncharacterized protein YkwD